MRERIRNKQGPHSKTAGQRILSLFLSAAMAASSFIASPMVAGAAPDGSALSKEATWTRDKLKDTLPKTAIMGEEGNYLSTEAYWVDKDGNRVDYPDDSYTMELQFKSKNQVTGADQAVDYGEDGAEDAPDGDDGSGTDATDEVGRVDSPVAGQATKTQNVILIWDLGALNEAETVAGTNNKDKTGRLRWQSMWSGLYNNLDNIKKTIGDDKRLYIYGYTKGNGFGKTNTARKNSVAAFTILASEGSGSPESYVEPIYTVDSDGDGAYEQNYCEDNPDTAANKANRIAAPDSDYAHNRTRSYYKDTYYRTDYKTYDWQASASAPWSQAHGLTQDEIDNVLKPALERFKDSITESGNVFIPEWVRFKNKKGSFYTNRKKNDPEAEAAEGEAGAYYPIGRQSINMVQAYGGNFYGYYLMQEPNRKGTGAADEAFYHAIKDTGADKDNTESTVIFMGSFADAYSGITPLATSEDGTTSSTRAFAYVDGKTWNSTLGRYTGLKRTSGAIPQFNSVYALIVSKRADVNNNKYMTHGNAYKYWATIAQSAKYPGKDYMHVVQYKGSGDNTQLVDDMIYLDPKLHKDADGKADQAYIDSVMPDLVYDSRVLASSNIEGNINPGMKPELQAPSNGWAAYAKSAKLKQTTNMYRIAADEVDPDVGHNNDAWDNAFKEIMNDSMGAAIGKKGKYLRHGAASAIHRVKINTVDWEVVDGSIKTLVDGEEDGEHVLQAKKKNGDESDNDGTWYAIEEHSDETSIQGRLFESTVRLKLKDTKKLSGKLSVTGGAEVNITPAYKEAVAALDGDGKPDFDATLEGTDWGSIEPITSPGFAAVTVESIYANLPTVTVTFNAMGGSPAPEAQEVVPGGKATRPKDPRYENYEDHFNGWYVEGDETKKYWDFGVDTVTEDMTLVADVTSETKYDLAYDPNGGSTEYNGLQISSKRVLDTKAKGTVIRLPIPTREFHSLTGFTKTSGNGSLTDTDGTWTYTFGDSEDQEVRAEWKKDTFRVTFNASGINNPPASQEIEAQGLARDPGLLRSVVSGKHHDGYWYTEPEMINRWDFESMRVEKNMTLYAGTSPYPVYQVYIYAADPSRFAADSGAAWKGSWKSLYALADGETLDLSSQAPFFRGHVWKGWELASGSAGSLSGSAFTAGAGSATIYATWEAEVHTVKFNAMGGTPTPSPQEVEYGDTADRPADPERDGYVFDGWYKSEYGIGLPWDFSDGVTKDMTLYARWSKRSYAVSCVDMSTSGEQLGTQRPRYFEHGATARGSVWGMDSPYDGYTYSYCSSIDQVDGDGGVVYRYFSSSTVTPYTVNHFKQNVDGSYNDAPDSTQTFRDVTGASVTPAPEPFTGFILPEPQTVQVLGDGSTKVDYYYERQTYALHVTKASGIVDITGDDTHEEDSWTEEHKFGEAVELYASVEDGMGLVQWTGDQAGTNKVTGADEPLAFVMPAKDVNISAYASADENAKYTVSYYKQRLSSDDPASYDDENYELYEEKTVLGKAGETVVPADAGYEGFSVQKRDPVAVLADGSSTAKVYYKRNSYTVTIEKGEGVEEVTGEGTYKFEERVELHMGLKDGYVWDPPATMWRVSNAALEDSDDEVYVFNMPAKDLSFTVNGGVVTPDPGPDGPIAYPYDEDPDDPARPIIVVPGTGKEADYKVVIALQKIGAGDEENEENYEYDANYYTTRAGAKVRTKESGIEGFVTPAAKEATIAEDGSTEIYLYYKRKSYAVEVTKGLGIENVSINGGTFTKQYGEAVALTSTLKAGYKWDATAKWSSAQVGDSTERAFSFTMPAEPVYVKVSAGTPANAAYTVEHYKQVVGTTGNDRMNDFALFDTETKQAPTNSIASPAPKELVGFKTPSAIQEKVEADGSTTIEYYYLRNTYVYTVRYLREKLSGSGYDTEVVTARAQYEQRVTPEVKAYSGFISPAPKTITISASGDNVVEYIYTRNGEATYTVNVYLQKLGEGNPADKDPAHYDKKSEQHAGKQGEAVSPEVPHEEGFTAQQAAQPITIAADGSSHVDYFYSRNSYDVELKAGSSAITYLHGGGQHQYGEDVTVGADLRDGYSFNAWSGSGLSSYEKEFTFKMPAKDVSLTATAKASQDIAYVVRYWTQKKGGAASIHDAANYDLHAEEAHRTSAYGRTLHPAPIVIEGFTSPARQELYIRADGTSALDYYYERKTGIPYRVEHHKQDIGGDGFTIMAEETVEGTGDYGDEITPPVLTIDGYISPEPITAVVGKNATRGVTVVRYYYAAEGSNVIVYDVDKDDAAKVLGAHAFEEEAGKSVTAQDFLGAPDTADNVPYAQYAYDSQSAAGITSAGARTELYRYYRFITKEGEKKTIDLDDPEGNKDKPEDANVEEVVVTIKDPDGNVVKEVTLIADDGKVQDVDLSDLPKYDENGNLIEYTTEEKYYYSYTLGVSIAKTGKGGSAEWDGTGLAVTGALPGAVFEVERLYVGNAGNFRDAVAQETKREAISGPDGAIVLDRMEDGIWSITETEAPDGYILKDAPIYLAIVPKFDSYDGEDGATVSEFSAHVSTDVEEAKTVAGFLSGRYFDVYNGIPAMMAEEGEREMADMVSRTEVFHAYGALGTKDVEPYVIENLERGKVTVTVTGEDGKGIPGVGITIRDKDGNTVASGTTDADGKIEAQGLDHGTYRMTVDTVPSDYSKPDEEFTVTVDEDGASVSAPITLKKKAHKLVILAMDLADKKTPLSGAEYTLFEAIYADGIYQPKGDGAEYKLKTGDDGKTPAAYVDAGTYYVLTEDAKPLGYQANDWLDPIIISDKVKDDDGIAVHSPDNVTVEHVVYYDPYRRSIPVKVDWAEYEKDGSFKRPESVTAELYGDGELVGTIELTKADAKEDGTWEKYFEDVPAYKGTGTLVNYTLQLKGIPGTDGPIGPIPVPKPDDDELDPDDEANKGQGWNDGNGQGGGGTGTGGTDPYVIKPEKPEPIINEDEQVTFIGTVVWDDGSDVSGIRPGSVLITLYRDNEAIRNVVVTKLSSIDGDVWEVKVEGLPKYKDGKEVKYSISDLYVPNKYESSTLDENTIVYSYEVPASITGRVDFNDDGNRDGVRPSSVTLSLLKNGVATGVTRSASQATGWEFEFEGYSLFSASAANTYGIKASDPSGKYAVSVRESEGRYYVTMEHDPERINYTASITWNDNNDKNMRRPSMLRAILYANGRQAGSAYMTGTGSTWRYVFSGLYLYEDGSPIRYTFDIDSNVSGYTKSVNGNTITFRSTASTNSSTSSGSSSSRSSGSSSSSNSAGSSSNGNNAGNMLGTTYLVPLSTALASPSAASGTVGTVTADGKVLAARSTQTGDRSLMMVFAFMAMAAFAGIGAMCVTGIEEKYNGMGGAQDGSPAKGAGKAAGRRPAQGKDAARPRAKARR